MRELPILFSGPMVRAILEGRKTQTRRVVKNQPPLDCGFVETAFYHPTVLDCHGDEAPGEEIFGAYSEDGSWGMKCPYGAPGDHLWVRETFQGPMWEEGTWDPDTDYHSPKYCEYRADGGPTPEYVDFEDNLHQGWKPSIFMPRWASRITLEITGVRVERLDDIGEADARVEGVTIEDRHMNGYCAGQTRPPSIRAFRELWDSINGDGAWEANPFVWVVEFKVIKATGAKT
jgi:hypothetical protein